MDLAEKIELSTEYALDQLLDTLSLSKDAAKSFKKIYYISFSKKMYELKCKHQNTIDVGDEDHMSIACADCLTKLS